ncbi:multidrug transporter [Brevibacillus reuszeri]|uniref:Multidrug transporter n=1 Tax=Brevibacillus reuszeri TaxID=54915 RepID=A0A0K9YM75_9BACL|nr:efflux RND transporter permease subunit [Brevibacillus reuszeri]KNB69799.1 multidrug transporter [Brevibacillus reuszeri]MED1858149.1 efflux RND transporter permease subunit [Brevibacillus reuszeri]GED68859.1 multidrug transporter [Brevibacillus reuszeri]
MNNKTIVSILPSLARVFAVICCLLAIGAALRLDIKPFPDRPVPVYTISLTAPGLSSDKVDETVTRKVEEAVRALGSAATIETSSRTGAGTITVETTEGIGSDYKERLEKKLDEITKQLPVKEYSISQDNLADSRIGYFLVHGADLVTLSDIARYTIYEKLISTPGIARVDVDNSGVLQQVDLVFRPSILLAYGLTPADVVGQLPGDVIGEQLGSVGKNQDRATFQWTSQSEGPQGLGKQLITTDKGYVPLKTLVDIRDLRGSKGDVVNVYHGSPAIGISVYAADVGQMPAIRAEVSRALVELNKNAAGKYTITDAWDDAQPISGAIGQLALLGALAACLSGLFLYLSHRRASVAVLSLLANVLGVGTVLGGMWVSNVPLTFSTLGPLILFSLLYTGAGSSLFHRLQRLTAYTLADNLREAWRLMKPLLLTIVVLGAGWACLMMTDFLEAQDRVALYDAWPVILLGTAALLLVYGFIIPTLAGTWLAGEVVRKTTERSATKAKFFFISRWERLVGQGYLPFGITLVLSLVVVGLFKSFVPVDSFGQTAANKKTVTLQMVQESSIDDAIRAAGVADERLRGMAEVHDLYTEASREQLTFHLQLADKYDWTRSTTDFEKELDKQLRGIPSTDPFALVVSENTKSRLEFTVKGPSLETTRDIANSILGYLQKLRFTDKAGLPIITDQRIGSAQTGTHFDIRPKQDMLARYRVTENEIKRQLESYLDDQTAGTVQWNDRNVAVHVRFPNKWMEHPDQVKNILIRTPEGTVRLSDLVDWSIAKAANVYERKDGLYVFKVSSAVSNPGWIDTMAYTIPLNMQKTIQIPDGYRVLNADELKKLDEELTDKKDWGGRMIVLAGLAAAVLMASLLLHRRIRDGLYALILMPVLSGSVLLGLLITDRPMNVMAFYGMTAALSVLLSQALVHLDELYQAKAEQESIWTGVQTGASRAFASQLSVLGSVAIASLPLVLGWSSGIDAFASFASPLLVGTLFAGFAAIVLIPGMQYAAEVKQATQSEFSFAVLLLRIRVWWENNQVRRQDAAMRKRQLKQLRSEQRSNEERHGTKQQSELAKEDFLPLSATKDANL